jgi:CRISPR-associated protein Csx16
MTTYFVTRHSGAVDWAAEEGIEVDVKTDHLEISAIQAGDMVIGTLPVNLVAEVCARGGRYLHLTLELPPSMRGKELTAAEMRAFGARVEEYRVLYVGNSIQNQR